MPADRLFIVAITLAVCGLGAGAQVPQPPPTFSSHSDAVVLHVTVLDEHGYVAGLPREAFRVYEDGRPQSIASFVNEDAPVTVGLVIDSSRSMGPKRSRVVLAGLSFARSSHPDDEMFVVSFNEHVRDGMPPGTPFTSDLATLHAALSGIGADGMTALYDAVIFGLERLERGSRQKKVLIVVSDGGDNSSDAKFEDVLARAARSDVVIYTIGVFDQDDREASPGTLKKLARATGGEALRAEGPARIVSMFERIARDIRSGYTIGYVPTNTVHDGRFRKVDVVVSARGRGRLRVRCRTGYVEDPAGGARP